MNSIIVESARRRLGQALGELAACVLLGGFRYRTGSYRIGPSASNVLALTGHVYARRRARPVAQGSPGYLHSFVVTVERTVAPPIYFLHLT